MDEREKNINGSDGDEYDKVCYVCRRPESKAGKMITLPGRASISAGTVCRRPLIRS